MWVVSQKIYLFHAGSAVRAKGVSVERAAYDLRVRCDSPR